MSSPSSDFELPSPPILNPFTAMPDDDLDPQTTWSRESSRQHLLAQDDDDDGMDADILSSPILPTNTLDDVLDTIGFGRYQFTLLVLCGFGWLADNMWLQGIALILPHVQSQFGVSDGRIGLLSSAVFSGMLIGAIFWGTWSDHYGRRHAFNATLIISTVFGITAAFAPTFPVLCFLIFGLGIGVGGHMPVDGCLFVEFCPKKDRNYLALLSVFFSIGSVVASALAVPVFSGCDGGSADAPSEGCASAWRWLVGTLGSVSLTMLLGRLALITLHESPKFLLAQDDRTQLRTVLNHLVESNRPISRDSREPESDRDSSDTFTVADVAAIQQEEVVVKADRDSPARVVWNLLRYDRTTQALFALWVLLNFGFT
ncbi:hypothetical protein HKX48_001584, partial [Thoreauomyces humboldtii]